MTIPNHVTVLRACLAEGGMQKDNRVTVKNYTALLMIGKKFPILRQHLEKREMSILVWQHTGNV